MSQVTEGGIVIIGAGQAGGWAAKTLRDQGYDGMLTVISEEEHDFYERPPLSKAVLLNPEEEPLSRLFSEETVNNLAINWRRPLRAEQILAQQQQVVLNNGERLSYQQLLLATGGRPRWPNLQWQAHPHVMALRSWEDAQDLKQRLARCQRLAIVGGGWIGLEIAASARKLGIDVDVFERQSALCMRSVGEAVSQALLQLHQQNGVVVHCDCGEITLSEDTHSDRAVLQSSVSDQQAFDLIVVGIGVELNLELAQQADLALGAGIIIDGNGRTSNPAIFAAGDVAQHPQLGLCIQSWAYAQNQAIVTARSMLDPEQTGYDEPAWLWSDQYESNIQILGIPAANTQCVERHDGNTHLYFSLNQHNQLVQLVSFNDARTIKLAKRWLASGRELDPQQLSDPAFSLMTLK